VNLLLNRGRHSGLQWCALWQTPYRAAQRMMHVRSDGVVAVMCREDRPKIMSVAEVAVEYIVV
jgi:hypothetical protein